MSLGKVLSIQSHVVHGYVGNRAAVFPMQLHGFEVDFINSVQFSNHTQYKILKGQRLNSNELNDLYEGLKQNQLMSYTHLLTGYVGEITFLNKLADIVEELKEQNPNLIYLCDPVLGDNDHWYVPKELLPVYKERLLPKADIITPNIFELENLTGKKILSEEDVLLALRELHAIGVKTVILSSLEAFNDKNKLILYASSNFEEKIVKIEFERLKGIYYGTGDTFAAMFLAWYTKLKNLKLACEYTVSAMLHILRRTLPSLDKQVDPETIPFSEIQLVQSKGDIENPAILVQAVLIAK